jgi:soluble lytic murein transglycosylase-like protein
MSIRTAIGALALMSLALAGCQTTSGETTGSISAEEARIPQRPYDALISQHAGTHGVPVELAHAVVFSESSYNADARGSAGEIGLMQLKLATARGVGYRGSAKALYDPATNIEYGMKYLGKAHQLSGGTTCGTILKYNAGHGAKRMNPVSQAYCNKVANLLE